MPQPSEDGRQEEENGGRQVIARREEIEKGDET